MNFLGFLLTFLIASSSVFAQTQAPLAPNEMPAVDASRLRLVGRGIINKKTGESIALACVGQPLEGSSEPTCYRMRHVLFSADLTQVSYLGSEYVIFAHNQPEEQTVKAMLKDMNHEFKMTLKPKREARSMKVVMRALPTGLAGALIGVAVGASGGVVAVAITGTWAVGAFFSSLANAPVSNHMESSITAVRDQSGWSWSEKPRATKAEAYNDYKNFIQSHYGYAALN